MLFHNEDVPSLVVQHLQTVNSIAHAVSRERDADQFLTDLIQVGLLKLTEIAANRPQTIPRCWMRIKGAMYDFLRKEHRRVPEFSHDIREVIHPDELIREHEKITRLRRAFDELPTTEQHVLRRTYDDEAGQQEIARELGISQRQVSRLKHRALRVMRPRVAAASAMAA